MLGTQEQQLVKILVLSGMPEPEREYRFAPPRRWRFDYCWVEEKIALEFEGGAWTNGRHTRGKGFVSDCEKYNEAQIAGWLVVRVTVDMVRNGKAIGFIERAFAQRRKKCSNLGS